MNLLVLLLGSLMVQGLSFESVPGYDHSLQKKPYGRTNSNSRQTLILNQDKELLKL